jgi:hypothetical protein
MSISADMSTAAAITADVTAAAMTTTTTAATMLGKRRIRQCDDNGCREQGDRSELKSCSPNRPRSFHAINASFGYQRHFLSPYLFVLYIVSAVKSVPPLEPIEFYLLQKPPYQNHCSPKELYQ